MNKIPDLKNNRELKLNNLITIKIENSVPCVYIGDNKLTPNQISTALLNDCGFLALEKGSSTTAYNCFLKTGSEKGLKETSCELKRKYGINKTVEILHNDGLESLDYMLDFLGNGFKAGIELYDSIGEQEQANKCQELKTLFNKNLKQKLSINDKEYLNELFEAVPNSKKEFKKLIEHELRNYQTLNINYKAAFFTDALLTLTGFISIAFMNSKTLISMAPMIGLYFSSLSCLNYLLIKAFSNYNTKNASPVKERLLDLRNTI